MKNDTNKLPYSNFKLFHPDGTIMCYCSKKRANWYLKRNLGELKNVNEIHLKFTPNGYGDPLALLEPRKNICVVSGLSNNLSRHHVIPTQYRKYLPLKYKDKNSCDVVLLERNIHDEYERYADNLKMQLENDFGCESNLEYDRHWNECQSIHGIIRNYWNELPPSKQIYFQLRYEGLIEKYGFDEKSFNKKTSDYLFINNKLVVQKLKPEYLITIWKLHFLKYAKPKYLPKWWKVNLVKKINKNKGENGELFYQDLNDPKLVKYLKRYNLYKFSKNYI